METKEIIKLIESDNLIKFYKCAAWNGVNGLRRKALIRDNYECQMCKDKGRYHKAENVHHVLEVKKFPQHAMSLENLLCVCITCHNEIHKRFDTEEKKDNKFTNEERW